LRVRSNARSILQQRAGLRTIDPRNCLSDSIVNKCNNMLQCSVSHINTHTSHSCDDMDVPTMSGSGSWHGQSRNQPAAMTRVQSRTSFSAAAPEPPPRFSGFTQRRSEQQGSGVGRSLVSSITVYTSTTFPTRSTHTHSHHHSHSLHKFTSVAFERTERRQLYTRTYLMFFTRVLSHVFLCHPSL
jgi:hypothetical protein